MAEVDEVEKVTVQVLHQVEAREVAVEVKMEAVEADEDDDVLDGALYIETVVF